MASLARWTRLALIALLVFEGTGTILLTLINFADRLAQGPSYPFELFSPMGGFGVASVFAAIGIFRSQAWGTVLAIASQLMVAGLGLLGLKNNAGAGLFFIGLGALGLLLVFRTARAT